MIAGGTAVVRAERERTDTQIRTLREAVLGTDPSSHTALTGPQGNKFRFRPNNGLWGRAEVAGTPEDVIRDLATGTASASIDEPLCVSPDTRRPGDTLAARGIDVGAHACEVTRSGRPFGSVIVISRGVGSDGQPRSYVRYGFGPDSGSRGIAPFATPRPPSP